MRPTALACCALTAAAASGTLAECVCSGASNARNNAHKRLDYGTVCASWDAHDEKPWCTVASKSACGADDTFTSSPGTFWAHKPCADKPKGLQPPPLPSGSAGGGSAAGATDVSTTSPATSGGSFQLHENIDAAGLTRSQGTLLRAAVADVAACQALCEATASCSGFAFYEGGAHKPGTKWHHACAAIGGGDWFPVAAAGVTSGKRCAPGAARAAAPVPFGAWDTEPVEASWPKLPATEAKAEQAVKRAMATMPAVLPLGTLPLGAAERQAWDGEGLAFLERLHTRPCTADTPMLSYIVPDVGFGNQLVQVLLHYAQAVAQGRSFVVIWPQKASWFAPKYKLGDLLRLSSCQAQVENADDNSENQKMWKAEAAKFSKLRQTAYLRCKYEPGNDWDNSDLEVPAAFQDRPLTWWYRMLTQYLVQPSKRVLTTSHGLMQQLPKHAWLGAPKAAAAAGLEQSVFARSYVATVATINSVQRPLVGMHIRGGDACADQRRPTVCITFANAIRQLHRNGISKGSIILSTDDEDVARDAAAYAGPFKVMVLGIDRKKLKSDTFVESRTDLDRVKTFEEMWTELGLLVQADVLLGSFYSNFARVALQLSNARAYIPLDAFWCPYCLCQLDMPRSHGSEYSTAEWKGLMERGLRAEITREHIFKDTSSVPLFQHAAEQLARVTSDTGCPLLLGQQ